MARVLLAAGDAVTQETPPVQPDLDLTNVHTK